MCVCVCVCVRACVCVLCSKLSRSEVGQFIGEFYQVHTHTHTHTQLNPHSMDHILPSLGPDTEERHDHSQTRSRGSRRCVHARLNILLCVQCTLCAIIGMELLKKLASIWTQFYTSILPTLQAIFAPVQVS